MSVSLWISIVVAIIAAISAITAAIIAARSANKIKSAEIQAKRIEDLESRISERKHDVYKPMIDLLSDLTDPRKAGDVTSDQTRQTMAEFSAWIAIYGSDDAVVAYHNYMQTVYASPPAEVLLRLYAEFVLAARRDMGYPETSVELRHLLGMRINDLYANKIFDLVSLSFGELCKSKAWTPPWLRQDTKQDAASGQ
jgi:hypothetical protein